jgi:hypothetical protein
MLWRGFARKACVIYKIRGAKQKSGLKPPPLVVDSPILANFLQNFTKNYSLKGKKIQCKVRRVNPYLFDKGRILKLSDINNNFHIEFLSFPKYKTYHIKLHN